MRSRSPFRNAVRACWSDIQAARKAELSLTAIYHQLVADGLKVGKALSSFTNAVRYWDRQDAESASAGAMEPDAQASATTYQSAATVETISFADDRYKSDF